jgi:hypothetical protein
MKVSFISIILLSLLVQCGIAQIPGGKNPEMR